MRKLPFSLILVVAIVIAAGISFALSDTVRFVICGVVGRAIYGSPGDRDREQVGAVIRTITTVHPFDQNSTSKPYQPPVSGEAGSSRLLTQPTRIEVYDVRDRAEQDRIIGAIKSLVAEQRFRPVDLTFMDQQNFVVTGNVGERGPETQLRRVRITEKTVEEKGGEQSITYPSP